jgi:hypothetical protein
MRSKIAGAGGFSPQSLGSNKLKICRAGITVPYENEVGLDGLTFISNLIRDLAWPAAMLAALVLTVRNAPGLAGFVKAIRFKDFELTIRENFIEARAEADKVRMETSEPPDENAYVADKVLRLAKIDPSVAIVEIWKKLERATVSLIQHNGMMRFTSPAKFVRHLAKIGKLTPSDVSLYDRLRHIRNASVHASSTFSPTLAEVLEFSDFVEVLIRKFEEIKREPGYITVPLAEGDPVPNGEPTSTD